MHRRLTLRFIVAGGALTLLTGYAAAQMPMPGISLKGRNKEVTPEERARQKALDDAYEDANKKIPDKQVANDPWGGVRPNPSAKGSK